jgi:DNA-binding Xre family transcriptional regulator
MRRKYEAYQMKVSDQLRKAIRDTVKSAAALSKPTTMSASTITRFLAGRQITSDNIDELCQLLGLELRPADVTKAKDKIKAPAVPAVDWYTTEPKTKRKDEGRERKKQ